MSDLRSKDAYNKLNSDFIRNMAVICPKCQKKAIIKTTENVYRISDETKVRLICTQCGYNKTLEEVPSPILYTSGNKIIRGRTLVMGGGLDPYFHLPLWYSETINGNLLWAYNKEHLEFIENHIRAKLRERNGLENKNRSIGSRLPKWMISKKNREFILKSIEKLKQN